MALGAPLAAGLFLKDPAVVAATASLLRITVWGSIAFGMASVFTGVMRAAGTVRVPTLISLGCLAFLLVPFVGRWGGRWACRASGLSYPLTYACALALQAAYFYGVWKKREVVRLV